MRFRPSIPVPGPRAAATVALAAGLIAPPTRAAPPAAGWALGWSDEFDGTSLDGSNWTIGTGGRRDAVNTASAVSVAGGAATIKTYTEGGTHYTGWLASNGKFENAFGYWEARIRFTSAAGMWSAFWLQPSGINNVGDPAGNGTEIDIVEHRRQDSGGGDLRNMASINIHWDGYAADHKSAGTTVGNPGVDGASLHGNYHTYGLLWEPGRYTFFIDGAQVWTTTAAVSNVRQWIYLTSEVENGAWAGNIPGGGYGDRSSSTTKMDVDWVRFWQRDEQVVNPDFTHRTGPWKGSGTASWASTGGRGGGAGVRLNPGTTAGSSFEQRVHGLLPNTPYRLLGWGAVGSRTWPDIRIGVKNHGAAETWKSLWSSGFTQAQVPFTTGPSHSAATVYAWVPTQWGDCYADDIELRRDAEVNNAGFELGEDWPWTIYGDAFVHDWDTYRRSGGHACRFNASAAARGAEQAVHGLLPDTTYRLVCWVRTGSQPLRLGAKNHGNPEAHSTFTGTNNTWQRASHTFTTGASATSATIYAYIPAGSNVAAADLDDFMLGPAPPAPWTAADVGATGRAGDSALRGGRLVLRGSGANVFDAADAFHFVYQPAAGDFALTTRLDSFEAASTRAKAGVMLRASTAAGAAHAMVHWLPDGVVEFIWRAADGAASSYVWSGAAGSVPWPPRLRLLRTGGLVTASFSIDGTSWTQVGAPQAITLPATALAGPAVCAHDTATTAVAVFSNTSFTGDRDGDGLLDDYETNTGTYVSPTNTGTDPDNPDTDGDGFHDGAELANGTNPLTPNHELTWQAGAAPGGTGTWDATTANWRIGSAPTPWLAGRTALFGGTAGSVTVHASAPPAAGLVFNTTGYTLTGTAPLPLAAGAVIAANAGTTTIACPLGGTDEVGITGGQRLDLRGDSAAFAGTLVVDGSTQVRPYDTATLLATGTELGGPAASVDLRDGAHLRWFNVQGTPVYQAGLRLNGVGSGGGVLNHDAGAGNPLRTVTLNGPLAVDSDATIGALNNAAFVINGPLTGTATLTVSQAAASTTLNGPVDLTGLRKTGAGTLVLGAAAAVDVGLLRLDAGTLSLASGQAPATAELRLGATLPVEVAAGTATLAGPLTGAPATIAKTGAGTLVLAGPNTIGAAGSTLTLGSGQTNAGWLRLAHPQALGNHAKVSLDSDQAGVSGLELAGGHIFPLALDTKGRNTAAGMVFLRNVDGHNTLQGNITITATGGNYHVETLAGSSLVIDGAIGTSLAKGSFAARDLRVRGDGDTTITGPVRDATGTDPMPVKLTKEGAGTLALTGTCPFTGGATVSGGTLRVDGALTGSSVSVSAGTTLAGTGTLKAVAIAGTLALTIGQPPLTVTGTLALNQATLALGGHATGDVIVLATCGAVTGAFASVTGVPDGYTLEPAHAGGTALALVRQRTPYEAWALAHALDPQAAGAPDADADRDGAPNLLEFALASEPDDPQSRPVLTVTTGAGELALTYRRATAATGSTVWTVEWSGDLAGWSGAGVTDQPTGAGDAASVEHRAAVPTGGATRKFLRVRVTLP